MRGYIRSLIVEDAQLASLGVVPEGVLSGDVDTPRVRPFINLKWGVTNVGLSTVNRHLLTIWYHDKPNDYTRILKILNRTKELLVAVEATQWTMDTLSGYITMVEWTGDSGDGTDDGHKTIFRQSNFTIIGN
jgi:hypothetical protein